VSRERLPAVELTVGRSQGLTAVLLATHAVAMIVVLSLSLPTIETAGALGGIGVAMLAPLRCEALRVSPRSVVAVRVADGDAVTLRLLDGRQIDGRLDGSSCVTRLGLVIVVQVAGRWRRARTCVAADAMHPQAFRRMRVRLLWEIDKHERDREAPI